MALVALAIGLVAWRPRNELSCSAGPARCVVTRAGWADSRTEVALNQIRIVPAASAATLVAKTPRGREEIARVRCAKEESARDWAAECEGRLGSIPARVDAFLIHPSGELTVTTD